MVRLEKRFIPLQLKQFAGKKKKKEKRYHSHRQNPYPPPPILRSFRRFLVINPFRDKNLARAFLRDAARNNTISLAPFFPKPTSRCVFAHNNSVKK